VKYLNQKNLLENLSADLVLLNGKIVTVDASDSIVEAVAVKGEVILKAGSTEEIKTLVGEKTKIINLEGKTVTPGFIDTHNHTIVGVARSGTGVRIDLWEATSMDDMVRRIKEVAEKTLEGEPIVGIGFDDVAWPEKRFPNRWDIDKATTKHPVYLIPPGGHCYALNSKALELANITKDTPSPPGGEIVKDPETGEPTGRLNERAGSFVRSAGSTLSEEETRAKIIENWPDVEKRLLSWGLTTILEASINPVFLLAYQDLLAQGKLKIRAGLRLRAPDVIESLHNQGIRTPFEFGNKLRVIGIKRLVDGSMGTRTAALHEPYWNEPENRGILTMTQEEITKDIVEAHESGQRVYTHAIGDRAIDLVLNAIEEALTKKPREDHRHTIEHCGVCGPKQLERMKRLGVLASASIGFLYIIGNRHTIALGPESERLCQYYPMRSFQEYGIIAGGNSDTIGPNWPMYNIYGMVTRKAKTGEELCTKQAISVMDAIRVYTLNGAYLEGMEDRKGSIEPGKLADMVILDRDILTCDPEEIKDFKVLTTIIGGETVYQKED
jgi:predicted amidohydrolase YtcJ